MDIFKGRYFNLNRKLFMLVGLWPYGIKTKIIMRAFFMISLPVITAPQLISAILHYKNADRLMLCLLGVSVATVMFFKIFGLFLEEDKMKRLYESIADNWLTIRDEKEREILVEYSERGRVVTIFYTISMAMGCTVTCLLPVAPIILDKIMPLQKPRPSVYITDGEYFVDREKYFVEFFFWDVLYCASITIITIAFDTMYIIISDHCCALNAIISYRLRNCHRNPSDNASINNDYSYSRVRSIIELHQKTLSFTAALNDSYSLNFFIIMSTNVMSFPLCACAIIANLNDPIGLGPYAIFFSALTLHLFIIFWPGQRVLDHNLNLCVDAYCNEWYTLPPRTKKLLLNFMLRCNKPASLNAAGYFMMNFETYSMVMRNAMSYITVLASFR